MKKFNRLVWYRFVHWMGIIMVSVTILLIYASALNVSPVYYKDVTITSTLECGSRGCDARGFFNDNSDELEQFTVPYRKDEIIFNEKHYYSECKLIAFTAVCDDVVADKLSDHDLIHKE